MFIATLVMLPATLPAVVGVSAAPAAALIAVVILGIVGTALAAILYFWLVAHAGARFTSLFNYLVPMWAVTLGILVLDETLRLSSLFALVLVIGGVLLTQMQSGKAAD
jgi:drug/metabolite transporter (DMT)-like permease